MAIVDKTPKITPASEFLFSIAPRSHPWTAVEGRLDTLRTKCFDRDKHRCVISGAFHRREAKTRFETSDNALDDEGKILDLGHLDDLEVAHIMPYAIMDPGTEKLVSSYAISLFVADSQESRQASMSKDLRHVRQRRG